MSAKACFEHRAQRFSLASSLSLRHKKPALLLAFFDKIDK